MDIVMLTNTDDTNLMVSSVGNFSAATPQGINENTYENMINY